MKVGLILAFALTSTFFSSAFAKDRTLISKCAYGGSDGGIEIAVGTLYSYIFGERSFDSEGNPHIENFAVQHEVATVRDDVRTRDLPELDPSKIFPAEFTFDQSTGGPQYYALKWNHSAIDGKTQSELPEGVLGYWAEDKWVNSTMGVLSALAFQTKQFGGYPHCMVFAMPGGI